MKKILLLSSLVMYAFVASAAESPEDVVIRHRHDEWSAAWNKHDPKLMASFFFPDGDLINPFGKHANGRAEIEALFTKEQSGPMAGTTYHGTIEKIRYVGISHSIAIVDVVGEIDGMKAPDGNPAPSFMHHVTWIAEKKNGKWMAHAARAFTFNPPLDGSTAGSP